MKEATTAPSASVPCRGGPFIPRSVCLLAQASKQRALVLADRMAAFLSKRGITVSAKVHASNDAAVDSCGADLVVVLGGDGSLISVARKLEAPTPVLGVNFGRVGFLSELQPEEWEPKFEAMLDNGLCRDWRMGLECSVERDGQEMFRGPAVNDLVLARGGLARIINLDISLNGVPLTSLRADGVILSTPTGSTGYTGSARGPILYPSLQVYAVTPICPYMTNFLPLVLPGETVTALTVRDTPAEIFLTVDGQEHMRLLPGDCLRVWGVADTVCFARFEDRSAYPAKLRAAGLV